MYKCYISGCQFCALLLRVVGLSSKQERWGCSNGNINCTQADRALCLCISFWALHEIQNAFAPDMYYVLLPPPAQGIWDSLLTSVVNPHLQLLSIWRQELILIPLLWAGRSVACLLSPPKSLWTDGALWLGKLKEEGVSGDRNSISSLGVFFSPQTNSWHHFCHHSSSFSSLSLHVAMYCVAISEIRSRCHCPEENPFIMSRGSWPGPWNSYGINTCC